MIAVAILALYIAAQVDLLHQAPRIRIGGNGLPDLTGISGSLWALQNCEQGQNTDKTATRPLSGGFSGC
jgi:hypothetical protein